MRTAAILPRLRHSRSTNRRLIVGWITRVLDYLFGLSYMLLIVRLLLEFVSARRARGFFESIRELTDPIYAPFKHIVGTSSIDGAPVIWSLVIAVLSYALLHDESRENGVGHGSEQAFSYRPRLGDELGEGLGEGFVESATPGEGAEPERHERVVSEEQGGPFVRSSSSIEFASGTDASNIEGATREASPTTSKPTSRG